jgi:hypothetical protein
LPKPNNGFDVGAGAVVGAMFAAEPAVVEVGVLLKMLPVADGGFELDGPEPVFPEPDAAPNNPPAG